MNRRVEGGAKALLTAAAIGAMLAGAKLAMGEKPAPTIDSNTRGSVCATYGGMREGDLSLGDEPNGHVTESVFVGRRPAVSSELGKPVTCKDFGPGTGNTLQQASDVVVTAARRDSGDSECDGRVATCGVDTYTISN